MKEWEKPRLALARGRVSCDPINVPLCAAPAALGALFAFMTDEDDISPVMLGVYDDFLRYLDGAVFMYCVNARALTHEEQVRYRIFSAPTLLWLTGSTSDENSPPVEVITHTQLRMVGTVMIGKLQREAEAVLDRLI